MAATPQRSEYRGPMPEVSVVELRNDASSLTDWAQSTGELHGLKEVRLRRIEASLVWCTAITAGLSGLSLFGTNDTATAVLSVATVILAGTNAAFKPAEKASAHATARVALFDLMDKLAVFYAYTIPAVDHVPASEVARLRKEYASLIEKKHAAEAISPYIPPRNTAESSSGRGREIPPEP